MDELPRYMVFRLEDGRYALCLETIERVLRAVEVTVLPKAPDAILGVVNVRGRVLPVFNLRQGLNLPEKEIDPRDQMIVARTRQQAVVLVTDEVIGILECPHEAMVRAEEIVPHLGCIEGVVKLADGLILIQDLDLLFSSAAAGRISDLLSGGGATEDA